MIWCQCYCNLLMQIQALAVRALPITNFTFITLEFHFPDTYIGVASTTHSYKGKFDSFSQGWGLYWVCFPSDPAVIV